MIFLFQSFALKYTQQTLRSRWFFECIVVQKFSHLSKSYHKISSWGEVRTATIHHKTPNENICTLKTVPFNAFGSLIAYSLLSSDVYRPKSLVRLNWLAVVKSTRHHSCLYIVVSDVFYEQMLIVHTVPVLVSIDHLSAAFCIL